MSTQILDPEIHECHALVIDGKPTSRSSLVAMLRDWGVGQVLQASRPCEARRMIEARQFDIVLCEQQFDGEEMDGQDLLDELRRSQLLPFSTVFIMVTGEATYTKVAEAAEAALDSYLLKPHNATVLGERLRQARRRKRVLGEIFSAIEAEDYVHAAQLCLERFKQRAEYWIYAARIGAELLLRLGRHDTARELFEAVSKTQSPSWAELGVARAHVESGNPQQARRTLESLLAANPAYTDAYDVMGRVQIDQGDLSGALDTFRRASTLTPGSVSRLQKQGMLAFYAGCADEAEQALDRAMLIGISAKTFDLQSLVMLAFLKFDHADHRGLQRAIDNLGHVLEKSAGNRRLQRFHALTILLRTLLERQTELAQQRLRALAAEIRTEDFDFEAASNMVALLGRLSRSGIAGPDAEGWLGTLAERFCISKTGTDLLVAALQGQPAFEAILRAAHAHTTELAEAAMAQSLDGAPEAAVQSLLTHGARTLNAKLIELATLLLRHHAKRIAAHAKLACQAAELHQRYCPKGMLVHLAESGRAPGAMVLRVGRKPAAISTPAIDEHRPQPA
jgi:DNA-binding response OmpR family regulator/Tfp pilus assembly protein PilF